MGNTDRIIRVIIAIIVAALYFTGTVPGILGIILMVVAAVFVLTSFFSICPLYAIVGIDTCSTKSS